MIESRPASSGGVVEREVVAGLHELIPDDTPRSYLIEKRVAFGESDREILGIAADEDADLIVVGTRGGGALGHLFGSTVRRVVRDATCPVLVVPAGHVWPATGLAQRVDTEPLAVFPHAEGLRA